MHSHLHTITRHQAYIEKVSLWIKSSKSQKYTQLRGISHSICGLTHCIFKFSERGFKNTDQPCLCLRTYCIQKRGLVTAHFHQEQDIHTETGKFMYKALTLHGKQLLFKRDRSRSHKSAIYSSLLSLHPLIQHHLTAPYISSYLTSYI